MNETTNAKIINKAVDNGSYDNYTPQANLVYETNIKSFNCSNIGSPVTVTLKVTDASGNTTTATAIVTAEDKLKPTVVTKNITVPLDGTGNATITDKAVDNGSSDNCTAQANLVFETNIKSFNCSNIGSPVTVTLKVTDASGNAAMETAIVTIVDNTPPAISGSSPDVAVLSPPNHKMRDVVINYTASDNCGSPITTLSV